MMTLLVIVHVLISLFLVFVVLIQGGKGAEMGASFGGSSQTVFGSRGAATFLNKLTTFVAFAFMATSLILAISSSRATSIIKASEKASPMSGAAPASMPGGPAGSPGPVGMPGGVVPGAPAAQPAAPATAPAAQPSK